ncbi:MAG: amidohydrolase [Gammaproteobacteria bacterium]|nr:amidohydrolase [Gammaproteobacteria bacterium]
MRDLTISLLQRELAWEDAAANRRVFQQDLAQLAGKTDLVILPEMFTTGFSMRAEIIAENEAQATLPWMIEQARAHDFAITGSLAVRSGEGIYNRLLFVTPDGEVSHYDKRHLFRLSGEHRHYRAGTERQRVSWRDWRICPLICYDLRFPVWSRNAGDYDLLIFVANWPAKRRLHWRQLLIARAIENQSYCVGVNRVGSDGNRIDYCGDSLVLAADGKMLLDCEAEAGAFTVSLDATAMNEYRRKFPCHEDADNFKLT